MLLIWIFIANICLVYCQYGVKLSVENSENAQYNGYLWVNSKIVFILPELKATIVQGVSKSEKICGFELRSQTVKNIPFFVYLLDELSGMGEMQVKPHVYLDNQSQSEFEMSVEAYDCDILPHYSQGATLKIHVLNESGPIFFNKSYTFTVRKDAKENSPVGTVKARSTEGNEIQYSIQNDDHSPFQIDQFGMIKIRNSLMDIKQSDIQIRVLAKEKSKLIEKQSLVFVTVEIKPVCQNKLTDIPDQLDYIITNGLTNMMEAGQLIQPGHRPILTICHLPSPLKEITLKISLKSQKSSSDLDTVANKHICQTDTTAYRIQRGICRANQETVDLLLTEGGLIHLSGDEIFGPEKLDNLGNEFTLSWWMKIRSQSKTEIFCFSDDEKSVTIALENCILIINHPGELLKIEIPSETCRLNRWIFFSITQQWASSPNIKVWIGGSSVASVTTKINLFQFNNVKLFVGQCSSKLSKSRTIPYRYKLNPRLEIGVISITTESTQKPEVIECLSICGEAIVTADSITTLSKVSVKRKGSSIYVSSDNLLQLLDSLTKIHYINSFYATRPESIKTFEPTYIWMDLSIECKSKQLITIPRATMRINFIGPLKDSSNDTIDVEIVSNATIIATKSHSIHIFPNLHFINANSDKIISKDLKIESCTVRLLQRNLVFNEKIYLSDLWSPVLERNKMEIRSDIIFWSVEGEADGVVYENILRQVQVDMINERKKFSILCMLKGGDSTNQAIVEVIQSKSNGIHYTIEDNVPDLQHRAINERRHFFEKDKEEPSYLLNITKSKFIGVIIMAVIGGAAWALVTAAITCLVLKKREVMKNRKSINNSKSYSKNSMNSLHQPALVNTQDVFIEYEYEEDRTSMADIPDDEEQNLDNISCETCNMTDPEVIISMSKSIKEIPRSRTITFPIIHRKF